MTNKHMPDMTEMTISHKVWKKILHLIQLNKLAFVPPYLTQPVLEFQLLAFCFTANKLPAVVEFLEPSLQTIRTVPRPDLHQAPTCLVHGLHCSNVRHDVITQHLESYQNQMSFFFFLDKLRGFRLQHYTYTCQICLVSTVAMWAKTMAA